MNIARADILFNAGFRFFKRIFLLSESDDGVFSVCHHNCAMDESCLFAHEKPHHVRDLLRAAEPFQRLERRKSGECLRLVTGIARPVAKPRVSTAPDPMYHAFRSETTKLIKNQHTPIDIVS